MIRFLRLFPAFVTLEDRCARAEEQISSLASDLDSSRAAYTEISTEKLLLQDRLESALADKDKLWEVMHESLQSERFALRSQVNHAVQKAGGGVVFPEAHALPAGSVRPVQTSGPIGRRGRMLPSEAAVRQSKSFMEELYRPVEEAHGSS